jgi:hypothetical protein
MKTIQILFVLALVLLSIDTVSTVFLGITVMEVVVTVMATEEAPDESNASGSKPRPA